MVYIYVLLLEKGKYYIGKTKNPQFRIESHFNLEGSEWTKLYKPIKILELISNCDDYDEDKYTRIYMDKYGIDNVRGGSFITIKLDKSTKDQLEKMSKSTNNKCFNCGESGHFAKDCFQNQELTISLDTIMFREPRIILENLEYIEFLDNLQNYKIKIGDIILNKGKIYNYLHEIIEDIKVVDKYTEKDIMENSGLELEASLTIKKMLLESKYKVKLMKELCEVLSRCGSKISMLQKETLTFNDIKNLIITTINKRP